MQETIYRFTFDKKVTIKQIDEMLGLAVLAHGCLVGTPAIRLEFRCTSGPASTGDYLAAICSATGEVGMGTIRVFTGLCSHEFGEGGFTVERIDKEGYTKPCVAAAG